MKLKRISEAIKSQETKTAYWWEKNVCKLIITDNNNTEYTVPESMKCAG